MCDVIFETSKDAMTIQQICPNCQTLTPMHFEGLQWWPDRFLVRTGLQPVKRDPDHPEQGALRLYSCEKCQSTFLEPTLANAS
ncbi:MAG: hypothetical protein BroJett018_53610 [Chloroflexota bacterium]|nr:MAG: hypothetical protein BroJett018_53610 [Chloroflexota bacterium]